MTRRVLLVLAFLLGLGACQPPTAPSLSVAQLEAEAQADQCAARFQSIRRYPIVRYDTRPGLSFWVEGLEVVGWGRSGKVTVAAAYQDAVPLLAHEILHAAYGWAGGLNRQPHDPRFALCQLWPLAPNP